MSSLIRRGSLIQISKVVAEAIDDGVVRVLKFDKYDNAEAKVVSVWEYPPDDRKFEVNLRPPNHGKIVVNEEDIGGSNASTQY